MVGQPLRVMHDRGLEGAVRTRGKIDLPARDARDRDDRRVRAFLQARHRGLDEPHRAHQVDLKAAFPALLGVRDRQRADVRDDDVDAAKCSARGFDPGLQRRRVADIRHRAIRVDAERGERGHAPRHLVGMACADRHVDAFARERQRDRGADAFGATGDQRFQSLESEIHGLVFLSFGFRASPDNSS